MTIGPEPITSTELRSVRLGTSAPSRVTSHEVAEAVEEVRRVVRPRGRLGVVLHRERPEPAVLVAQLETLDHVVVEADVADRGLAVRRDGRPVQGCVDG